MSGTDNGNQGNEDRAINMLMRRASRNRILPKKPPPIEVPIEVAPFEGKAVMQPFCVRIMVAAQMLGVGRTKIYHADQTRGAKDNKAGRIGAHYDDQP